VDEEEFDDVLTNDYEPVIIIDEDLHGLTIGNDNETFIT
jgi:hypothetical protein